MKKKIPITTKNTIITVIGMVIVAVVTGIFTLKKPTPNQETTKTVGNYSPGEVHGNYTGEDSFGGNKIINYGPSPEENSDPCEKISFQLKYFKPGLFEESDLNNQLANYDNCISSDKKLYKEIDYQRCIELADSVIQMFEKYYPNCKNFDSQNNQQIAASAAEGTVGEILDNRKAASGSVASGSVVRFNIGPQKKNKDTAFSIYVQVLTQRNMLKECMKK